jgi:arginyl-tRNA synthetase
VLARVKETFFSPKGIEPLEQTERELLKVLSVFPEKTLDAMRELEPSIIARYILDVCNSFNRFYQECPIATAEDEKTRIFRAALTLGVKYVTGSALELVCMKHPIKI